MRRLLVAAVLAAVAAPAVPAHAVCTPYVTNIRACGLIDCNDNRCQVQPYVDPQCVQNHLHTAHCAIVENLIVVLPST